MALHLFGLPLPLPLQSHLSLALCRPPFPPFFPCFGPQISNARQRGWGETLILHQGFSSIVGLSSTSTTESVVEDEKESSQSTAEARRRLIAQNIPWTCTADEIRSLFETHGTVVDVELSMYGKVKNRGLAFITMASEEEALATIDNLNSYDFGGRKIKVEFSTSLKKKPSPATTVPVEKYSVFVGNLSWRVRSRDLRELFNANGDFLSADVVFQTTEPRRSAGYGFVSFSSKEAAEAAIATYNGKNFMGRSIRVMPKENQKGNVDGKLDEGEPSDQASNEVTDSEDLSKQSVEM